MKRILFILLLIITVSGNISAQSESPFHVNYSDSAASAIGTYADYSLNSNALTNTFISAYFKGRFIDTVLKDKVSAKLRNNNQLGADLRYGIYYLFNTAIPDLKLFVNVKDREHIDAHFSNDFFKLAFYGNKQFAGQTANLNGFKLNLLRYQQLQFGLIKRIGDKEGNGHGRAIYGIGFSFIKGEEHLSMNAKKAELYTSPDGQFIDFNTSMQFNRSDTANKGYAAVNGLGASLDLFAAIPYTTNHHEGKLFIKIEDVGSIHWNKNSLVYKSDSLFHFEGFEVNNIFELQDSTFNSASQDSIVNDLTAVSNQSYFTTIPATIDVSSNTSYGKIVFIKGFRYMFNANYKGYYYLKGNYSINPDWMLSASVGYGGYGTFNFGAEVVKKFKKEIILRVGSSNLEGFIAPQTTAGQGVYFSLRKSFL